MILYVPHVVADENQDAVRHGVTDSAVCVKEGAKSRIS